METLLGARTAPLGMRNLGENDVKETGVAVGALASATNGGTICQAPAVSGPAPGPATVEAEVEVSFEGSAPDAQVILLRPTIPSGLATDDTKAAFRASGDVGRRRQCGVGIIINM